MQRLMITAHLQALGADPNMSGAGARRAAAELLWLTCDRRRTLDEAMSQSEAFEALEGADRSFARAIASEALRDLGRIDTGLQELSSRPLEKLSPSIRALARAALAQLWKMNTEPHAAVSATVDAAKGWPDAAPGAGFLNAVLRRATREPLDFETISPLKIWPGWLAEQFATDLGQEGALVLARAQLREPHLHLTPKGEAAALAAQLSGEVIAPGSVKVERAAIESLAGYESGDWWVQDAAASLPARLLGASAGDTVVDLCAAPGGKTLQLAATGADVLAVDRSKARLQRLDENVARAQLGPRVQVIAEKVEDWRPDTPATHILLDAPCSAFGTLRRHPEGAWIKTASDIARFPAVQSRMVSAAADMIAPDGTLIYCVCTPLRAEGRDVIDAIVAEGVFARAPFKSEDAFGFESAITPEGDLLTLPVDGANHDAFFISRLTRTV